MNIYNIHYYTFFNNKDLILLSKCNRYFNTMVKDHIKIQPFLYIKIIRLFIKWKCFIKHKHQRSRKNSWTNRNRSRTRTRGILLF